MRIVTVAAMGKSSAKQKLSLQSAASTEHARTTGSASNQSINTVGLDQSTSSPGVVADCDAAIKDFERGSRCGRSFMAHNMSSPAHFAAVVALNWVQCACRAKSKKALQKLAKDHPSSPLPHRYLVIISTNLHPYVNAQIIYS